MPGRAALVLLAGAVLVGCSQAPQPVQPAAVPEPPAEEAAPQAAVPAAADLAAPPPAEAAPAAAPAPDPTVIVIDPGGEDPGDVDVVAAAKAERERRATAPRASRTITNENLVKASPGDKGKGARPPSEKPAVAAAPAAAPGGTDEAYWRGRSRELRQRWKDSVDEIAALEKDADLLRRRFYAESDPYVRDGQIKPDWDRVLDRIREMREESERRQGELAAHLEAGRRAGALPGWLREGSELEPAAKGQRPEEGPHEAIEPPVYPEPREPADGDDGGGDG